MRIGNRSFKQRVRIAFALLTMQYRMELCAYFEFYVFSNKPPEHRMRIGNNSFKRRLGMTFAFLAMQYRGNYARFVVCFGVFK